MAMVAQDPADGSLIKSYPEDSHSEVESAIELAQYAYLDWRRTPFSHRAERMEAAAEILRSRAREFGELMTLEDADLDAAASVCAIARLINSGQSCIAAKRFVVVEAIRDELKKRFLTAMREVKVGDPMEADTVFGLGAAVFTKNPEKGTRIAAEELEAGACLVNDFVRSDPRLPFGGVKESGYGRELSPFGILEFVNIKTVWVA